jgi:ferredoxin
MADKNAKVAESVAGKYYVDSNCISCGQCKTIAEKHFAEAPSGIYYVSKQPASPEEVALCEEALSNCPVNAIGNDGE